ncbi:hypothetical protein Tco_0466262 [Tanacetum coccineum]
MTFGGDGSTAGDGNGSRGNGSGGDEDDLDLLQDENGKSDDGGEDDDGKSDGGNGGDDIGISFPGRAEKISASYLQQLMRMKSSNCSVFQMLAKEFLTYNPKVGKVAYRLELPQELSRVHHTFHVSNLKKCYADEPLVMPLEGIHVDDKLQFVEEPVEIIEREIKRLKRSRIPLVKVRWNSRRGPEFTWEREDSFKQKYPQLFTNRASSSTTRS